MPSNKLPNYLRTFRKRAGFSQDEVAFLLSVQKGSKVCRYERFARTPSLETALAFEVLFRTPTHELFRGVYQKVEKKLLKRAALLYRRLMKATATRQTPRKIEALRAISSGSPQKQKTCDR